MKVINGICLSRGIAIGKLHIISEASSFDVNSIRNSSENGSDEEILRYRTALERTVKMERELYETAKKQIGEADAALFLAHAAILEDITYIDAVEGRIRNNKCTAETAVQETGDEFYRMFLALPDAYMRARAIDVRDVTERLLESFRLGNDVEKTEALTDKQSDVDDRMIMAAGDLSPSQTMQLDRTRIAGFVTLKSAPYSHTAILARSMDIPAMTGIAYEDNWEGMRVILDGESGILILEPDPQTEEKYRKMLCDRLRVSGIQTEKTSGMLHDHVSQKQIRIYANLADPADINRVLNAGAAGIGLFRSEALFLKAGRTLTEDEQYNIYKQVLIEMKDKPVVIRTFNDETWQNGIGIVFGSTASSETEQQMPLKELYRIQLRALYRAGSYGNLRILYPMICSVEDVKNILALSASVKEELKNDGIDVQSVLQGIMIETSQAADDSMELAKEVDFFSIGTNDLTRFVLETDRNDAEIDLDSVRQNPVLLELIRKTIDNAHHAGIPAMICGELGADPAMHKTFAEMGVDGISAAVNAIPYLISTQ